jgi:hypothetical protein
MDTGFLGGFYLSVIDLGEYFCGSPQVIETQSAESAGYFGTAGSICA